MVVLGRFVLAMAVAASMDPQEWAALHRTGVVFGCKQRSL